MMASFAARGVAALACLLLSAGILISLIVLIHGDVTSRADSRHVEHFPGRLFQSVEGRVRPVGHGVQILGPSRGGRVLLSSNPVNIDTASVPYLQWSVSALPAGVDVVLFWRRKNRNALDVQALKGGGAGPRVLRLSRNEAWQGTVAKIGVAIQGASTKPFVLEYVTLRGPSTALFLTSLLDEWLSFHEWTQRSAHFLVLGEARPAVPLVPAVAAWVALALTLYGGLCLVLRDLRSWGVAATIVLAGWLVLDARWGLERVRQLRATYDQYAGKTWDEKNRGALDGELYGFLAEVKAHLPTTVQRVFFLTDKRGREGEFERERARYHLLPHNAYVGPHRRWSPDNLRPGDYVVAAGAARGLANREALQWAQHSSVSLELVLEAVAGRVYRRRADGAGS
jgi:hypothetical protein